MKNIDAIFWYRRDLRTYDNRAFFHALTENEAVLPIFIFDKNILSRLQDTKDKRVSYIYDQLVCIQTYLRSQGSNIAVFFGTPDDIFDHIISDYDIGCVYANKDYDPYSQSRDKKVKEQLSQYSIGFKTYKDHVIFEEDEIVKDDNSAYLVYTPYSKKWLAAVSEADTQEYVIEKNISHLQQLKTFPMIFLSEMGFEKQTYNLDEQKISAAFINAYHKKRDIPADICGTSHLSTALRFGVVLTRHIVRDVLPYADITFLKEIIWRDFFHMMLFHFPHMKEQEITGIKPQGRVLDPIVSSHGSHIPEVEPRGIYRY